MQNKSWFEVSKEGLKELQSGKPKHFIVRELIQNAWDEDTTLCEVGLNYSRGVAQIKVTDDNPPGFKDITDAYTLFKTTPKRSNPKQRGRFNIGEKQSLSCAECGHIITTKGKVVFDKRGRHYSEKEKRDSGTEVLLNVKMSEDEYNEILKILQTYLPPKTLKFVVNGNSISQPTIFKKISVSLETEVLENEALKRVWRKTDIHILKKNSEETYLYEMGIPVCSIDCKYQIDVQQKIPLSIDRESVTEKYFNELYAEVLNSTYSNITPEEASSSWIRQALANKRISEEALKTITEKRFGEKVVVANPFDKNSIDEALSRGYNVVYGSELSAKEWENLRKFQVLKSSTDLFGGIPVKAERVKPTENQLRFAKLAKKIAKDFIKRDIKIIFVKSKANTAAQYGNQTLTYNLSALPENFFDQLVSEENLDLLIHELSHEAGLHTEKNYHELLSELGAQLIIKALSEPSYFKV